jgi:hypothetical protein
MMMLPKKHRRIMLRPKKPAEIITKQNEIVEKARKADADRKAKADDDDAKKR